MYRAKRKDNGEWIKGYYWKGADHAYMIPHNLGISYDDESNRMTAYAIEIDPGTLCQYTEKDTSDGRRVWENDILKYHFGDAYGVVRYGEYHNCFDSQKASHQGFFVDWIGEENQILRKDLGYWIDMVDGRVVGNVFDNPELL